MQTKKLSKHKFRRKELLENENGKMAKCKYRYLRLSTSFYFIYNLMSEVPW